MGELDDTFKGLTQKAEGNKFSFDNTIARNIAELCTSMLYTLDQIEKGMEPASTVPAFSSLPSGPKLAEKFKKAAKDFHEVSIKGHRETITNMADLFIKAGKVIVDDDRNTGEVIGNIRDYQVRDKKYFDSHQFKKQSFSALNYSGIPDDSKKLLPKDGGGGPYGAAADLEGVSTSVPSTPYVERSPKANGKFGDQKEIDALKNIAGKDLDKSGYYEPEDGHMLTLKMMKEHYTLMKGNIPKIEDVAQVWNGGLSLLANEISDFKAKTGEAINGRGATTAWEGESAQQAKGAILRYCGELTKLQNAMQATFDNLRISAGWLRGLQPYIPEYDEDDWARMGYEPSFARSIRDIAAAKWNDFYLPGYAFSRDTVVQMPEPAPKPKASTPPEDRRPTSGNPNNGNPNSGNPGSGNPGGGGGNQASQLAALEKQQQENDKRMKEAQEKLDREAKEKAAEDKKRLEDFKNEQEKADQRNREQAQQQAAQQAAQQGMQAAQQAVQQGMQTAQQAAQQGMQAAQAEAAKAGLPSMGRLAESALNAAKGAGSGAGKGGGAGGGAGGGIGGGAGPRENLQASRLFPRASVAAEGGVASTGRAGVAAGSAGAPGMGGPMGGGGAGGAGGQNKEHKRADYLDSSEHLEEALGEAPVVAKPVVEQ
ncbi:hypothetical protein [Nocardia thraciensis]